MSDSQKPWPVDSGWDPYRSLASGVVLRAVRDLADVDDKTALGALCFLLKDAPSWCDAANIDVSRGDILNLLDVRK